MKITIVEGNSSDKDNVRVIVVKGEKGDMGDLNHNDIIDNLGSSATDKVLSAKQGKVLKDKADEQEEIVKQKPYYFDTVAEMKLYELKAGDYAITKGYYEANDGGAGQYEIVDDDTLTDDGGSVIELGNGLKAKLIIKNNIINVKQYGAKGDNSTNDYIVLNKAINSNYDVYIPNGNYIISNTIQCVIHKKIYGEGTLKFNNSTGDGLILGDGIQIDGINITAIDGFTGILLKYDGTLGQRVYPSTSRFSNLVLSSNTNENIDCIFDFLPDKNYGIKIENVIIGNINDTRKANFGFRSINNNWANSIIIDKLIIDIWGANPFYVKNLSTAGGSGRNWSLKNVLIQIRNTTYDQVFYIYNLTNVSIIDSYIWDTSDGTFNINPCVYEKTNFISVTGSGKDFYMNNAKIIDPIRYTDEITGMNSDYNNYQYTPLAQIFKTGDDDKLYPLLFPTLPFVEAVNDIELMTRFRSQHNHGLYFKMLSRGLSAYNSFYARDVVIFANKYNTTPIIYGIELYAEGTVVWVKGNSDIYARYKCGKEARFCTGEILTAINSGNSVTMTARTLSENTPLPETDTIKYFYNNTSITTF